MIRTYSTHGAEEECLHDFVGKVRRRPLGRSKIRSNDNIKIDLRET
jgi:hypothetical protein